MLIVLKILHMASLFAGGAAGIGNGILLNKVIQSGKAPPPIVAQTMGLIGRVGFVAVVLLWISGIWMLALGPAPLSQSWAFWVKLAGATLVLVPVSLMTAHSLACQRAGKPPDLMRLRSLSRLSRIGVAVAIVFAVLAFG